MNKLILMAVSAAFCFSVAGHAGAATYKGLHGFCAKTDCGDGQQPRAGLTGDGAGNYYGTTTGGGAYQGGAVFRFSFDGAHWKYTRLHSFCRKKPGCTDGYFPQAGVVIDTSGNLYGLTSNGGPTNHGTLYKLSFVSGHSKFRVLHNFCTQTDCKDGAEPFFSGLAYQGQHSGALYDGSTPLYGTTNIGGAHNEGTVFSFMPDAGNGHYDIVYNFCRRPECTDGAEPYSGVSVDAMGRLYGAALGGMMHVGVVYRLEQSGGHWTDTVLHDFCSDFDGSICQDGMMPVAAPLIDAAGDLLGTTAGDNDHDHGIVYKIALGGAHPKFTKLHSFCALSHCNDGAVVTSGLTMDASGNLFGVTLQGGYHDCGTLFELGGAKHQTFATLRTFHPRSGAAPLGALALGPSGELIGTLSEGGRNSGGVVFSLTP